MLNNKEIDVTSELYRVYTYANGATFRIDLPVTVVLVENENGFTQRVIDSEGVTHRPSKDFVGISWKPKDGFPAFVA